MIYQFHFHHSVKIWYQRKLGR